MQLLHGQDRRLTNTKHKNLVANTFGDKLVTGLIGHDTCRHSIEREEPLIHILLELKNEKSIQERLESYVTGCTGEG